MKNIKVRIWDKENKKMLRGEGLCFFQDKDRLQLRAFEFDGQPSVENEVILQFTGIVDSYHREIYIGDIVQTKKGVTWEVLWDEELGKLMYKKGRSGFGLTKTSAKKTEIIGNIYENPELLSDLTEY